MGSFSSVLSTQTRNTQHTKNCVMSCSFVWAADECGFWTETTESKKNPKKKILGPDGERKRTRERENKRVVWLVVCITTTSRNSPKNTPLPQRKTKLTKHYQFVRTIPKFPIPPLPQGSTPPFLPTAGHPAPERLLSTLSELLLRQLVVNRL